MTALALLVGLVAAYLFLPAIGSISPRALQRSVTHRVGGSLPAESDRCRRRGGETWDCEIRDAQGSGRAVYRVTKQGRRCWQARKASAAASEEGPPLLPLISRGCVELRDQLRPAERIL